VAESRSTAPSDVSIRRIKAARATRRLFFLSICAVLVASALELTGVRSDEVSASGGGYELQVAYDDITRGGLAANLTIEIRREGGFRNAVSLAITSKYLDIFDVNGVDPEPLGATSDADRVVQMFQAPERGDVMAVGIDARVQPGIQLERVKGTVAIVENGQDVVSVELKTLVLP
jgi:hypothetical protein